MQDNLKGYMLRVELKSSAITNVGYIEEWRKIFEDGEQIYHVTYRTQGLEYLTVKIPYHL